MWMPLLLLLLLLQIAERQTAVPHFFLLLYWLCFSAKFSLCRQSLGYHFSINSNILYRFVGLCMMVVVCVLINKLNFLFNKYQKRCTVSGHLKKMGFLLFVCLSTTLLLDLWTKMKGFVKGVSFYQFLAWFFDCQT